MQPVSDLDTPAADQDLALRVERALAYQIYRLLIDAVDRWISARCWRYSDHELNITARIFKNMRDLVAQRDMRLILTPEKTDWTEAILSGEEDARGAARFDISITSDAQPDDWHFVVECKRLGKGVGAPEYVEAGVLDFVVGRYGASSHWGAMLGYVVSSTSILWLEHVNNQIRGHAQLGPAHELRPATDVEGIAFASDHPRQGLPAISLRHLWFELEEAFSKYPPKRQ